MALLSFEDPYCYTLFLSGEETKRVLKKKVYNGKVTNFTKPVTLSKTPKIYILKHKKEIVYVGYASQSMGLRIGQGMS